MIKNIKIKVTSKQRVALMPEEDGDTEELPLSDGEPVVTVVESEGTLEYKDGVYTVQYLESPVTGMEDCITNITFNENEPNRASIYRAGPIKTMLLFREGERYISVYDTGFTSFEVSIVTDKCENTINENGGVLSIVYTVEIRGAEAEHTELTATVTPDNEE